MNPLSATGDGGDCIIIDDFNQASESDDVRRNALEWYSATIPTRLNDPKKGSIISIQQRTAQNDLTGHLLEEQGHQWELLKLQMEYEGDDNATSLGFKDPRTENGELLNPARFGPE